MRQTRGFSLIEVTVVSALMVGVMLITFQVLNDTGDAVAVETTLGTLNLSSNAIVENMSETLRQAWIPDTAPALWRSSSPNLYAGANEIRFLVPVDYDDNDLDGRPDETQPAMDPDDDNDILDDTLNIEWGAIREDIRGSDGELISLVPGHFLDLSHTTDPTSSTNRFYTEYRFIEDTSLTFDEAARNYDLDQDGAMDKTFRVGRMVKSWPEGVCNLAGSYHDGVVVPEADNENGDGAIPLSGGSIVILGDWDDDGVEDPIFTLAGATLTITLHVSDVTEREPLVRSVRTTVDMLNIE